MGCQSLSYASLLSGGVASDTAHLQPLLAFLHDQPYGSEPHIWQVSCPPHSHTHFKTQTIAFLTLTLKQITSLAGLVIHLVGHI